MKTINIIKIIFPLFIIFSFSTLASEFELRSEKSFEPEFNNRLSISFGLNPSLARSQDAKSMSISLAREWEKDLWVEALFQTTGIKFSDLADNNVSATGTNSPDLPDEAERVNTFGAGVGLKSRLITHLLPFDLYELTNAALTYSIFKEELAGESFKGPGIKAMYAVMKPIGEYTHIGVHFDYHLMSLKRDKNDDEETSSQRGFNATWMTVGFNISFFL